MFHRRGSEASDPLTPNPLPRWGERGLLEGVEKFRMAFKRHWRPLIFRVRGRIRSKLF